MFDLPSVWQNPSIRIMGKPGVVLFFVLSGFLISFLLMKEQSETGRIHIRNFYRRRILHVWPLYFLFPALLIFPYIAFLRFPGYSAEQIHDSILVQIIL